MTANFTVALFQYRMFTKYTSNNSPSMWKLAEIVVAINPELAYCCGMRIPFSIHLHTHIKKQDDSTGCKRNAFEGMVQVCFYERADRFYLRREVVNGGYRKPEYNWWTLMRYHLQTMWLSEGIRCPFITKPGKCQRDCQYHAPVE